MNSKSLIDSFLITYLIFIVAVSLGTFGYSVTNPHLTRMQIFLEFWWLYVPIFAMGLFALVISRIKDV